MITIEDVEQYLPQTQCGLCGYGGCRPYAEALVKQNAPINLCLPGDTPVMHKLANILKAEPLPLIQPPVSRHRVAIDESACIGCLKCLIVCPVDAIVGAAKKMHTVIADHCTGCDLCLPVCPMNCIDIIPLPAPETEALFYAEAALAKARYQQHQARLAQTQALESGLADPNTDKTAVLSKKQFIAEALARVKAKKQGSS